MSRRYQIVGGGGSAFASGGITNNVVPKSNGAGALADSSITDNGTIVSTTEPIVTSTASSNTVPVIRVGGTSTIGLLDGGANTFGLQQSTSNWIQISSTSTLGPACLPAAGFLSWSSSNTFNGAVGDTLMRRRSAANFGLGATDVNGVPVAQTLSVQNAIAGSNLAAADMTIDGGLGTGTGAAGRFFFRGNDSSVASGTTAQTNIVRCVLNATKTLTTGAATTLVSIPLASLAMCGGYICVYMEATDGTAQATRAEEIYYAGENSAGVFVVSSGVVGTGVTACTAAKTLTATYALTGANPALLQVTPTLTGITATRFTCVYEVHHLGNTQPTV